MSASRDGAVARVPVLTVLPADPEQLAIGGIASFVRGFVKFAPPDFDLAFLGVSDTRPVGRWSTMELEGRPVRLLPVTRGGGPSRERVPIALRFAVGVQARRSAIRRALGDAPWIHAFHRPSSDIGLPLEPGRAWRVDGGAAALHVRGTARARSGRRMPDRSRRSRLRVRQR